MLCTDWSSHNSTEHSSIDITSRNSLHHINEIGAVDAHGPVLKKVKKHLAIDSKFKWTDIFIYDDFRVLQKITQLAQNLIDAFILHSGVRC